ncbi:MAG: signal peptidase I [bacterium]|nr:signal peptidase I [bacterium]
MAIYSPPKMRFLGWLKLAGLTFVLAIGIRLTVIQTFAIPSHSMEPGLLVGDYILVNQLCYGKSYLEKSFKPETEQRIPERGDVVVFSSEDAGDNDQGIYFVKRIVGLPGEAVEISSGRVFIDGRPLEENYLETGTMTEVYDNGISHFQLAHGEYFVLGDNRRDSLDSRDFGPVRRAEIEGCAEMVYWSWDRSEDDLNVRWSRVGRSLRTNVLKSV